MPEIECPHHRGERFDPEAGPCPLCALGLPVDPLPESAPAVEPAIEDGEPDVAAEVPGEEEVIAADDGAVEPDPPPETLPAAIPLTTRVSRAREPADGEQAPETATSKVETADPPSNEEIEFFDDLARIQKDRLPAILFFGFRTAGKTWLLHRIKEQLSSANGEVVNCDPPFVPIASGSASELPGTNKIEFHRVFDHAETYVLIDIPGEFAEDLVDGKFDQLRMLLAAMAYAKAIIVALPVDILFFGDLIPKDDAAFLAPALPKGGKSAKGTAAAKPTIPANLRKWAKALRTDNARLDQFTAGLFRAAGALSFVRHEGIDLADPVAFRKVTPAAVNDHLSRPHERQPVGGRDGLDCPTFFALTKADRVLALFFDDDQPAFETQNVHIRKRPESRVFDRLAENAKMKQGDKRARLRDPWELVRHLRPTLHSQLISSFPMGKFDYVTAFYGHDGSPYLTSDHYKHHPQQGVSEILDWIADARQLVARRRMTLAHYALASRARRHLAGYRTRRRRKFSGERRPA